MFFFCLFAVSHILSQLKSFEIQNLIHVFFQPIVIKDTLALYFSKEVGSKVMFKSLHFDWNTKTSYQALLMLLHNFDILHCPST
jgi:hypothetical protein